MGPIGPYRPMERLWNAYGTPKFGLLAAMVIETRKIAHQGISRTRCGLGSMVFLVTKA